MLTETDRAAFRQVLQQLLREKTAECQKMSDTTEQILHPLTDRVLPDRPERQGDSANEADEQEIDRAFLENANVTVHEIEAALQRLSAGTFGLCGVCTQPIAKARLRALPTTRYCLRCAELVQ